MSEKCFCHLNGYVVKDATARAGIEALDQRVEGNEDSIRDLYKKEIHTFNSVEEMNAANLADGSIACVPSSGESGGGGLQVIDITTPIVPGATLTAEESSMLSAAYAANMPFIARFSHNIANYAFYSRSVVVARLVNEDGMVVIDLSSVQDMIVLFNNEGTWTVLGGE